MSSSVLADPRAIDRANFILRLKALAPYLGVAGADEFTDDNAGILLSSLAKNLRSDGRHESVWLALSVMTGRFPSAAQVLAVSRALQLASPVLCHRVILEAAVNAPDGFARMGMAMDIVEGAVVVDVDFCATHQHNTGIQRVVRHSLSRWERDKSVLMVAWTHPGHAMRTLSPVERERVVNWTGVDDSVVHDAASPVRLVVPYLSHVLVPEVPQASYCAPLAGLAQYSNNAVGMIGYDAIPVLSADIVPSDETERFGAYLAVVKHSTRVAGISAGATQEFAGFASAVGAQGLSGPETIEVQLPVDSPDRAVGSMTSSTRQTVPSVLCVGSQEPRKNQLLVLFAAETLWREGLEFTLTFVGGASQRFIRIFDSHVRRLRRAGRTVTVRRGILDSDMLSEYLRARFTVFPSLQEGYGLPVAESLNLGIPVITTNYGSTAEIARDGGCLVVDPRDDASLVDAMRLLLTDNTAYEGLVDEISARPNRTWDDYASDLWRTLVSEVSPRG